MTGKRHSPHWHLLPDRESLARSLAGAVEAVLVRELALHSTVTFLVSGGRSPALFFEHLAQADLDWARVCVMPVDERVGDVEPESRNESLIRNHLLQGRAAQATFIPLDTVLDAGHPEARVPWPAAVAVLGMGEDGHCASWFPGDPASARALVVDDGPRVMTTCADVEPRERLTLNWPALAQARERLLLITGDAKRGLLERIASENLSAAAYPVARLLSAPLEVFWSP